MYETVEVDTPTYVNYTEEDIERVAEGLNLPDTAQNKFLELLGGVSDFLELVKTDLIGEPSDQLISVKFTEGVPDNVYTPALFNMTDDDKVAHVVLQIGRNKIHVRQEGDTFLVGDFKGTLRYSKEKGSDGSEYTSVTCLFKNSTHAFNTGVVLAEGVKYSQDDIEVHLEEGKNFGELLRPLGGIFLKMRDVPIGTFPILDIIEAEPNPNADFPQSRFHILIAEGLITSPNASLKSGLESFHSMCENFKEFQTFMKTQSLRVVSKTEKGGKTFVKAVFVLGNNAKKSPNALKPAKSEIVPMKSADAELVTADTYPI